MSMNKTGIDWCDMTWNPVTGCESRVCQYCYARKIAERFKGSKAWPRGFEPTFHPERLNDPRKMKKSQTIFVCSMGELFGYWVPASWQNTIFTIARNYSRHTYIFLTKNPQRMMQSVRSGFYGFGEKYYPSKIPENLWFGTTITSEHDIADERIEYLKAVPSENRFISFEPLLGDVPPLDLTGIKQVIIGAQTNPTVTPPYHSIQAICKEADRVGAKVFFKDSLVPFMQTTDVIRRELAWPLNKSVEVQP